MKVLGFIILYFVTIINQTFAEILIECSGLPGCDKESEEILDFIGSIVAEMIKYVAVLSVIALIGAGFMYIFSGGEEEPTKKAKKWIIWSLVAVFISISGYFLINLINNANINF